MATITSASLGELLKRLYAPFEIEMLINLTYPALAECARKSSAAIGGSGFYFPVRTAAAHGHAYISESDTLPAGRQSEILQAVVSPTVHAGVVQLTGLSMAVSSGNAMSFARSFDENVQSTIEAMSAYKEGVLFRDGTGLLTRFSGSVATAAGTAFDVDDPSFLRPGMEIDIIDNTAFTRHSTDIKISAVDWANKTVTFSDAIAGGVDDNDRIYITDSQAGSGTAAPINKEPIGLEGSLLSTGSYLGIDRSSVGPWQANNITVSAFLDEGTLLQARTRITQVSGTPYTSMGGYKALCHPMQVDTLFKLAIPRIRYSGGEKADLGNSQNPSFGGIDFVTSYQCPPAVAYIGDFGKSVSFYTPGGELAIDTEYNGSALKWVSTQDVGLVFVKEYCAFAVTNPVGFARLSSLTEQTR
jgi:hypothetical protein